MKETYIVTVTRPRKVSIAEMKIYIQEAVETWGGSFRPPNAYGEGEEGHPLFGGVPCEVRRQK